TEMRQVACGKRSKCRRMTSSHGELKRTMQAHSDWTLRLFVVSRKETRQALNACRQTVTIPVATSIDYHFQFTTAGDQTTGLVILRFNPQSQDRPSLTEYSDAAHALERNAQPAVAGTAAPVTPHGINTTSMDTT